MNETLINVLVEKLRAKATLEKEIAELKTAIETELPEDGYKNDDITISRKKASESVSLDLKVFAEKEPTLYGELLADYGVKKLTKASVSYTVKKDKE